MLTTSPEFKANARRALADAGLQKALAFSGPQFMARRTAAVANLPEFERLRDTVLRTCQGAGARMATEFPEVLRCIRCVACKWC